MTKTKPPPLGDGWYESEESTRLGMIAELQRIVRRTVLRPVPVILLGVLITAAVTYKVATKKKLYTADVVLAISEGSMTSNRDNGIPFDQLREYVDSVLLPDSELEKLIEQRTPGRIDKVGKQFALEQFRGRMVIQIWKNSFVYFHDVDANAQKSARIGIEVTDEDPDTAYEIARDLASIVIKTHDDQRRKLSAALASEVEMMRKTMNEKVDSASRTIAVKQGTLRAARRNGQYGLAAVLLVDLAALEHEQKRAQALLAKIVVSPDALADQVTAARLDTTVTIVDERRPERPEQSGLVLAMIIAVIGTFAMLGAALVLGAFDSRVHDTDDVARLGLPVLGHVPGFPGDHVGSLDARGAARARVPSFLRWLSQR